MRDTRALLLRSKKWTKSRFVVCKKANWKHVSQKHNQTLPKPQKTTAP
jgi:hypothetical protein